MIKIIQKFNNSEINKIDKRVVQIQVIKEIELISKRR